MIEERYAQAPKSSIEKFLREHPDVDQFLGKMVESEPWFTSKRIAFSCVAKGVKEPVRCRRCGAAIDARKWLENPSIRYCSRKCSQSSPERLEKMRATSMSRYGCGNAMQSKEVRCRLAESNMRKYGVENVFQLKEKQAKIRETNMRRYGEEHFTQTEEFREKSRNSMLSRYGTEYASQSGEVRERVKATNLARYGGVAPACSADVVEKMKRTNAARYGSECSLSNPEVAEKRNATWMGRYGGHPLSSEGVIRKRMETNVRKYGSDCYPSSPAYFGMQYDGLVRRFAGKVEPVFGRDEYRGMSRHEAYRWRCCRCGNEFESRIYITDFDPQDRLLPRCPSCHPFQAGVSSGETELLEFVRSICKSEVVHGDRDVIRPYELDIYIPEKRVAIEFDGLYWHSEGCGKDMRYHLDKTVMCEGHGIRLIHVFEDEWRNRRDIVKDRIRSVIGAGGTRIYARKCAVREISAKESSSFLDANHLQGSGKSSVRYGLFHEDELVAVMTFGKPRFNRSYDWEMIRFASKIGYSVVGGASRLLAHFRRERHGSIISYADRRYSNGNLYERLGFERIGVSEPNYWYVKNFDKLSRYACQKSMLPALLGAGFHLEWSEYENMMYNGWNRIYDCGNIVYVMR